MAQMDTEYQVKSKKIKGEVLLLRIVIEAMTVNDFVKEMNI